MKKQKPKPTVAVPLTERPTITHDEFCGLIGIGRTTAYKAIDDGDLKASKYGKRTLIKQEEWRRFVRDMPPATATTSARWRPPPPKTIDA